MRCQGHSVPPAADAAAMEPTGERSDEAASSQGMTADRGAAMEPTGERSDERHLQGMRRRREDAAMEPTGERSDELFRFASTGYKTRPQWSRPASGRKISRTR